MEVEYELTPEDVIAFQRYHQKHSSANTKQMGYIVFCVLAAGAFAFILFISPTSDPLVSNFVAAGLAVVCVQVVNVCRVRWTAPTRIQNMLNQGKNAGKILGWRRFVIDAEGINNTSEFSSAITLWKGIDKVATTDEYLFLYTTTITAHIVPMRVFADGRAFDAFVDAAKRYHGMAGVGEGKAWKRRGETGIQAPDYSGKLGTVEGIVPKEGGPGQT